MTDSNTLDKEIDALFDDAFERGQDIVLIHKFETGKENYKQYRDRSTKGLKSLIADEKAKSYKKGLEDGRK